jgi:hypothetical protein
VAALAVLLVLAAAATPAAPATTPRTAPAPRPTDRAQPADAASLRGTFQTPWVARDGTWELRLDVAGTPPGARVEATLHPRIEDREAFNNALFGLVEGDRRAGVPPIELDAVAPGASGARAVTVAFSLRREPGQTIPGWAFLSRGLQVGVHPVLVQVVDAEGEELTHTVAFLTRVASEGEPGADDAPLLVAPVLGLDLPPADGSSDPAQPDDEVEPPEGETPGGEGAGDGDDPTTTTTGGTGPTGDDDDPTGADEPTDEGGATDETDEAVADDPTVIDPARLADAAERVDAVADGLLSTPDLPATLVPRPRLVEALGADPSTRATLAGLRRAGRGRQVVDGTFVEVAVPAWVDAGLSEELARQREWGNVALTEGLGLVDSSTWDASTGLTDDAVAQLWPVGIRSAILPPGSVDGASTLRPFTLSAGSSRTVRAMEVHEGLSLALTRTLTLTGRADPVLDEGAFAAELALTAASTEGRAAVVVRPPTTWPTDDDAVARLGELLLDPIAPVRPVSVSQLLDEVDPSGAATPRAPEPVDLGTWPERLDLARRRLLSYASLATEAADEVAEHDRRLLVSGDVALSTEERIHEADVVLATLDTRFAAIEAPARQTITLTARDGRLPLTLRNQLDGPATVAIELDAARRVDLPDGPRMVVELQPGTNQIEIPVHTRVPGDAPIDITIRTVDGAVTLDEVRYTVRSTAVSGIGLILSIGAAAFLLLWWARHWSRARRTRHRAAHPSAGDATADAGPADTDDGRDPDDDREARTEPVEVASGPDPGDRADDTGRA